MTKRHDNSKQHDYMTFFSNDGGNKIDAFVN